MPIYEYACTACGHEFEEWQKMSDPPVRTCPKCKKKKVERLISRTAFQLKGSGWYADLYASSKPGANGKASAEGGASDSSSGGEAGGSAGAEGKAEAKASAKAGAKADSPKASKGSGSKKPSASKKN